MQELEKTIAAERAVAGSTRLGDLERVWAGYSVRVNQPLQVDAHQMQRFLHLLKFLTARVPQVYVIAAPIYDPEFAAYPASYREDFARALREISQQVERVKLLPEFTSDCTMFFDTVHLNHVGGDQFTTFLQREMGSLN
jgi:lysophospholipase L1-like esterase